MGLRYENLDAETRRLMIDEINYDLAHGGMYISSYLNEEGEQLWPALTQGAATNGTDDSLAADLARNHCLKTYAHRRNPRTGGTTQYRVPSTAPQTMAEAQFNLYYIRALCLRVLSGEATSITVYRARHSDAPRPESERLIGRSLDAEHVLNELRRTKGVDPDVDIPLPNSGITIRLG